MVNSYLREGRTMTTEETVNLLNLLLNTPSNIKEIDNHVMRNYIDSLATYVEKEARSVSNAAELLRERKIDFED